MGQDDPDGIRREWGGDRLSSWIEELLPSTAGGLAAGGAGLLVGMVGGVLVSHLRRSGMRVAYTRKLFHLVVFSGAAVVHSVWGLPGTNAYGAVVAVIVLVAVGLGDGNGFYEALARDSDRPHRAVFVVVPLVTTAVGGLASALLAGPHAAVGYLVCGWGDAVGEPVGSRWGRHRYRVPSMLGVAAQRSVEGSAAVFGVGWVAAVVALSGLPTATAGFPGGVVGVAFLCAVVGMLAEAVSNHGLDNLTVQVAASATAMWLAG